MVSEFESGWHISTFSNGGGCVEARRNDGAILVRHSKDNQGPQLIFSKQEWLAFVAGVRNGEFDITDEAN